jgi:hypothetical protein
MYVCVRNGYDLVSLEPKQYVGFQTISTHTLTLSATLGSIPTLESLTRL